MSHHQNYKPPEQLRATIKIMSQHKILDMPKLLNSH